MKKKLFKLYLLLFVPLFFFSSLLKAKHVDLQILDYTKSLEAFKIEAEKLLHEWSETEEKADFVKRNTLLLKRFFHDVNSLAEKVRTKLNLDEPYSKMTRNDIRQLLKSKQIRQTTKDGSCTPCTKIPFLDETIWAHDFLQLVSCGKWCGGSSDDDHALWASIATLGIYPLLMGYLAGLSYITQGLSLFVTLPCRPRCSCPETEIKEEYNGPLELRLEMTIRQIDYILSLISSKSLPEAEVVAVSTKEET